MREKDHYRSIPLFSFRLIPVENITLSSERTLVKRVVMQEIWEGCHERESSPGWLFELSEQKLYCFFDGPQSF
jgi:hypothetical protein